MIPSKINVKKKKIFEFSFYIEIVCDLFFDIVSSLILKMLQIR